MLKVLSIVLQLLPISWALGLGNALGYVAYIILPRKTRTVYLNLKTAFGSQKTHQQLKVITRQVYSHIIMSFIEVLIFPKIHRQGFEKYVTLHGREYIELAKAQGKGIIFLAMHAGNWEIASVVGALTGVSYNLIANRQPKMPELDRLLNEHRKLTSAKVLIAGEDTKEIIQAIKRKEILSIAIDQGGREGAIVPFLGKPASFGSGAIRLGLKYDCALCPVWIRRTAKGHRLEVFPALDIKPSADESKDVVNYLKQAAQHMEPLLTQFPDQYLWFYKVYKYTNRIDMLICDDGRTGHLRQSQAVASSLRDAAQAQGKETRLTTIKIEYRSEMLEKLFQIAVWISYGLRIIRGRWLYHLALTADTVKQLDQVKADCVISTGSMNGALAWLTADINRAKSIAILKQGLMPLNAFDRVIVPEHDGYTGKPGHVIPTKVAVNLIDGPYLNKHVTALLERYSHLKSDVRLKFGVLIGGDTKGVKMKSEVIRLLFNHLKNACVYYKASLLVTTSRRTPPDIEFLVEQEMQTLKRSGLCIIENQSPTPEAMGGILGLADIVVVSGESISMVSEAISSGKMTIIFSPLGEFSHDSTQKYDQFALRLADEGYAVASNIKDIPQSINGLMSTKRQLKKLNQKSLLSDQLKDLI